MEVYIPTEDCKLGEPKTYDDCQKFSVDEFNNEVKYSLLASELEIGPKVYSSWICDNVVSPLHKAIINKMRYSN